MMYLVFADGLLYASEHDFDAALAAADKSAQGVGPKAVGILRIDGRWVSLDSKGNPNETPVRPQSVRPLPEKSHK